MAVSNKSQLPSAVSLVAVQWHSWADVYLLSFTSCWKPLHQKLRMLHHLRHAPLLHHLHPRLSSPLSSSSKYLLILSNSSSAPVHRLVHNSSSRGIVRFRPGALCTAAGERAEIHGGEEDGFFANDGVTWKSLGISDRVVQALTDTGFHGPSLVQVLHMNCSMKCSLFLRSPICLVQALVLLVSHVLNGMSSSLQQLERWCYKSFSVAV